MSSGNSLCNHVSKRTYTRFVYYCYKSVLFFIIVLVLGVPIIPRDLFLFSWAPCFVSRTAMTSWIFSQV